ncbi:MAG: conjugal transfer protein TraG [Henriciella sp.]
MSPSKILVGQFAVVLFIVMLTMWGATQWVAYELGFQAALGKPWFVIDDQAIYKPWRLFQWWYAYEAYAPSVFARGGLIAASGGLLGILAAVIGSVWRSRWERHVTTFGSARWGNKSDLNRAGLLKSDGVFLGRWNDQYIQHGGPEHVLAFAPTRSGKGVGLVIPTLLSWTGSAVIHDIKGENWDLTSGWRSSFSKCVRFDPTDNTSARFNPLMEIRKGSYEVRDVQNIADILVDPEGSLERRNHWEKTAHALLVGTILHVIYAEKDKTLSGCARFLSDPARPFETTLNKMISAKHIALPDGTRKLHPIVAQAARELLNKSENERSGVLSTALSFLGLYRDPVVAEVTASSDWKISDLMAGDRPVSLYLVVPPSDLSRTKPLMRLVLNQIGRRLTETLPDADRRKILLMLDEFPALGRLDFFESALAFMAGYGVRAYLIAQSLNQIEKAYGPNNAILDNCHVRIAFSTNDERTAKRISEALGTKTQLRSQKNYTGHRLAPWLSHMMVSRQETQRALMTPGEVMQMPSSDEIIMVSGCPPILAKKLRYFEDRNFTERILSPAVDPLRLRSPDGLRTENMDKPRASIGSVDLRDEAEGKGIEPTVNLPEQIQKVERDAVEAPEIDEAGDVDAEQTLETLRRAATLDLSDDNTLPEF